MAMFNTIIQEVLVGDTFLVNAAVAGTPPFVTGTTGLSGNFTGGPSATQIDAYGDLSQYQLTAYDPATRLGVSTAAFPDEIVFSQYYEFIPGEPAKRDSLSIRRGTVTRYNATDFAVPIPFAMQIDLNANPVVGDWVELVIIPLMYREVYKYDIRFIHQFTTTVIATELQLIADQINESTTYMYQGQKPLSAIVQGGNLLVISNPVIPDFSNILPDNSFTFDMRMSRSYDLSANVEQPGWEQLFPTVAKTTGNYSGGTFAGGLWSGGTYNSGAYWTNGVGNPKQVTSHYWGSDLGYRGKLNRVGLGQAPPYNPVNPNSTYNCYTLEYTDTSVGLNTSVRGVKKILTIYLDNSDPDVIANFEGFMDLLVAEYSV